MSLQRIRSRESGPRGRCAPATVRPQRFSRSRRLTPPETCPGLFHPGNAPGIRSSGVSPPAGRSASPRPILSCRWPIPAAPVKERREDPPGSRGLIPPGVRSVARTVKRARRSIPSWPCTLWGSPSSCRSPGFPGLPLLRFTSRSPRAGGRGHYRGSTCRRPGISSRTKRRPLWALPPRRPCDLATARPFR